MAHKTNRFLTNTLWFNRSSECGNETCRCELREPYRNSKEVPSDQMRSLESSEGLKRLKIPSIKGVLFTGAQASKKLEKTLLQHISDIYDNHLQNSETLIKRERLIQRCQQKFRKNNQRPLYTGAHASQNFFQRFCEPLQVLIYWFVENIWFEDVDKFLEKELFPGFCLLGRLWQRNLWLSLLEIC